MRTRLLACVAAALSITACAIREGAWVPHDFSALEAARLANTYRLFYIAGLWLDGAADATF
jgi:hypothetical protein